MSDLSETTNHENDWNSRVPSDDSNFAVTFGANELFDAMDSAAKPQIKLEVLSARQLNRVIVFNVITWLFVVVHTTYRTILNNKVRFILKQVKMPNGIVKTLKCLIGNHWDCWIQFISVFVLSLVATAFAVIFSIRMIRSRKEYKMTLGQKMSLAMVISLAVSMQPFMPLVVLHDICLLDSDPWNPKPSEWNGKKVSSVATGFSTMSRAVFFSASSILYTWAVAHILGEPEVMTTKRKRTRFYAQKLVPLVFYSLLKIYGIVVEKVIPTYLPFTSFIGMVQNFSIMETWYPRVVGLVTAITIFEAAFVVVIILRMFSTSKVLRASNYIETRMRQVSFRFLIWTTIAPLPIFYIFQVIDRLFGPRYFPIAIWLRDPSAGPNVHYFNTSSNWFDRDLLLLAQAIVIAYAHLPIDSDGFMGWFKSSRKGHEDGQNSTLKVQPISLSLEEDKVGDGPDSLNTSSFGKSCVLPTHILLFNFTWLAYAFEKENHGSIIPEDAQFTIKCHIKQEDTDTNLLIASYSDRIVVTFKGTTSTKNIVTDLKVLTVPLLSSFPTCEQTRESLYEKRNWRNAKIHKGFMEAYSAVSERLLNELREMLAQGPKPIFCTGHSLGGALATLCSLDICTSLSVSPENVVVSTFGSPRCGNSSWRAMYDDIVIAHWRFAIEDDVVTMLPRSFTYDHVGKQVLLKSGGNMFLDPSGIEGSLFGAKGASLKNHKKRAYMIYLNAYCEKYLFNFEPMFWKGISSKNPGSLTGKSNFNTKIFLNVVEALEK